MSGLHIVADRNIPFVREAFSPLGDLTLSEGRAIDRTLVEDADVLLVRSVTDVDEDLLGGTSVGFVGSATAGLDHLDVEFLKSADITYAHAPGSNARSVVEYVLAALLELSCRSDVPLRGKTVAVVGCGNVGGRLCASLSTLGVEILQVDPPLADEAEEAGEDHTYLPLTDALRRADIVTLHVPLYRTGPYSTRHLIDASALNLMGRETWLVNTSRGGVVNSSALVYALERDDVGKVILDVWEEEPEPAPELVKRSALATPHIAGHSVDGKVAGTIMVYKALREYLGRDDWWGYREELRHVEPRGCRLSAPDPHQPEHAWLRGLVRRAYPIDRDDVRMRRILEYPSVQRSEYFRGMRAHYPARRAFHRYSIAVSEIPHEWRTPVAGGLHFDVQN